MSDPHDAPPTIAGLGRLLNRRRGASPSPSPSPGQAPEHTVQAISASALTALFAHTHEPLDLLHAFATGMEGMHGELGDMGERLQLAYERQDWQAYGRAMRQLIDKYIRTVVLEPPRLDDMPSEPERLRDLLRISLGVALAPLLKETPELAGEARQLGDALAAWQPGADLTDIAKRIKSLGQRIDIQAHDGDEQQSMLIGLFNLLLENVSELLDDGSWLQGQIAAVRDLISGPLDRLDIEETRAGLREVIYKQGLLKQGIAESKAAMKTMMGTFVDRLDGMAASTGEFHDRIASYSLAIRNARSVADFNRLIDEVLLDTRRTQDHAMRARDDMLAAREAAEAAEQRAQALEQELRQLAGLIRSDQLTGSLNRRGLDDRYAREVAQAERESQPLCLAMLDVDDFRKINETHGHPGGDAALRHLVDIARNTLRANDSIARFGGEEFVLLLPNATLYEARASVARIQQALLLRPLQYEGTRVPLTFSGGVAERKPGEPQADLVKRADRAMYEAKLAGKNCVVSAG